MNSPLKSSRWITYPFSLHGSLDNIVAAFCIKLFELELAVSPLNLIQNDIVKIFSISKSLSWAILTYELVKSKQLPVLPIDQKISLTELFDCSYIVPLLPFCISFIVEPFPVLKFIFNLRSLLLGIKSIKL